MTGSINTYFLSLTNGELRNAKCCTTEGDKLDVNLLANLTLGCLLCIVAEIACRVAVHSPLGKDAALSLNLDGCALQRPRIVAARALLNDEALLNLIISKVGIH